jgi:hypothetical protein
MPDLMLLGIAIPAYKRTELLDRLLKSIQAPFPVTVSDNGGNLPSEFKERHASVRFLVGPEVPVLRNWNRAAESQSSEWIVMPGDDDLYYPDSFETIERVLLGHPTADIVFFGHHIIDERDSIRETWQPEHELHVAPRGFDRIRLGAPARPPSIVFRRSLYERLGGFPEDFKITAGDNHFYQRASLVGTVLFASEVVSGYRVWNAGSTSTTIATSDWLREVDHWCTTIQAFCADHTSYRYTNALRDEIYMANLRAGIRALKERGQYVAAWRHVIANRYPFRASPAAQVKLLAHLLLPHLK